ncbi:MAG TPA: type II toxin-antitoxin system prevent-host-death family antitoxin [Elusimicrobia bacterium]|nr:MAG: prevent-host-death protein [Elusimicrobia bacterium GWA2_66_18]OGR73838.1 MAG: prevent-host-death protein [Elusimicrobia bacterium GWC2_65_9]HAZ07284.1 type II toxin-antitoxin system prevent-host-death family antitoxin [Elusimicrobiota bacterium]
MKNHWQLQEAKSRFSEVVDEALSHGPQQITRHGEEVVVILSTKEFKKLTRPKGDIVSFFSRSPFGEVDIDLSRSKEKARGLDL